MCFGGSELFYITSGKVRKWTKVSVSDQKLHCEKDCKTEKLTNVNCSLRETRPTKNKFLGCVDIPIMQELMKLILRSVVHRQYIIKKYLYSWPERDRNFKEILPSLMKFITREY